MDDLIKQITDKTGISMDQAKGAIEQVMNFLGDKLPGPIASQVKGFLGSDEGGEEGGDGDDGGGLMGKIGGLLGN